MSRPASPPTLLQRLTGRGRVRVARLPDAADLGTCFGMEHWLDEAQALPPQALLAAQTSPGATVRRSWLRRWRRIAAVRG